MNIDRAEDAGTCSPDPEDPHENREADIALARACASGDEAAIRTFEAAYLPEVKACRARLRGHALALDELEQRVREKLFVKGAIGHYSGKGSLRHWLRVVTARLVIDHVRELRPEIVLEEQLLNGLKDRGVEIAYAKAELQGEARAALRLALGALTDRQKLLLSSEARGVALSSLAAEHRVHVRSMQRWVREAHSVFLAEFRRVLAERLRVMPDEVSSMVRFVRSQLASGLGALVRDTATPAGCVA
ncbi:MAG TPA: hypothetical protein VHT91_29885 [Kofleriaceae bacterium]|jgi:RNA polymerase sigma-70 factor (ECF subfamily)|nr:hypothetical protein [Kofleriaceae bacterium]